jgi:hypothetical protein
MGALVGYQVGQCVRVVDGLGVRFQPSDGDSRPWKPGHKQSFRMVVVDRSVARADIAPCYAHPEYSEGIFLLFTFTPFFELFSMQCSG